MLRKCLISIALFTCVSAEAGSDLTAQQRRNFCDTVDNVGTGDAVSAQIKYLAGSLGVSQSEFLGPEILDNIPCNGKAIIFHAADQEKEDVVAFIKQGFDVNRIVRNIDGRSMTVVEWLYQRMYSEPNLDDKATWRRKIYELKAHHGGRRCSELPDLVCVTSK